MIPTVAYARRGICAEARRHDPEANADDPQAPNAAANLAWALYLALREPRLNRPLADALNAGRETNAIAALVGAVAGARLGSEAISKPWRESLLAREFIERRVAAHDRRANTVHLTEGGRKILRDAAPSGHRWSSIVLGIAKSVPFQMRRSPEL